MDVSKLDAIMQEE